MDGSPRFGDGGMGKGKGWIGGLFSSFIILSYHSTGTIGHYLSSLETGIVGSKLNHISHWIGWTGHNGGVLDEKTLHDFSSILVSFLSPLSISSVYCKPSLAAYALLFPLTAILPSSFGIIEV